LSMLPSLDRILPFMLPCNWDDRHVLPHQTIGWNGILLTFCSRLASNLYLFYLHLSSSWDYRRTHGTKQVCDFWDEVVKGIVVSALLWGSGTSQLQVMSWGAPKQPHGKNPCGEKQTSCQQLTPPCQACE
jgi:hypothetical protein